MKHHFNNLICIHLCLLIYAICDILCKLNSIILILAFIRRLVYFVLLNELAHKIYLNVKYYILGV